MKKIITLIALFCVFKASAQSTIIVVSDTTALKAYSTTTQHQLYITDQNTSGIFEYYASGYTANGGTVFASNTGGFWVRQFTGPTNLKWFGAQGNGVTDDTKAMKLFINDSYSNKYIPSGIYMLDAKNSFNIKSNTSLVIDNSAKLQVTTDTTSGYILFRLTLVDNVKITGGALIGERSHRSSLGYGVYMDGATNCSISNINISNFYGDGVYVGGSLCNNININQVISNNNVRQGMSISNVKNIHVSNSSFINTNGLSPQSGIDIEPNSGFTIANVTIENVTTSGNSGSGIIVTGVSSVIPIKNITLKNIISANNSGDGIAVTGGATSAAYIQGLDIYNLKVDTNGSIGAVVAGVNNANMSHVVINQSSGLSNLYFEKIVKGSVSQFLLNSTGASVIGIYLGTGNTSMNISEGNINTNGTLINVTSSGTLSNSSISNVTGTGSTLDGFSLYNLINCTVSNNSINNVGQSGLNFLNGSSNTVVGNIITGAGMTTNNTYAGIRMQGTASKFTVQANQIFNGSNANSIKWGIECDAATAGNQVINNYLLGAGITAPTMDVGTLNVFYNPLIATANNQVAIANGAGGYIPTTISGDVTNAGGVFTIGANKITYDKMQAMTANKLLGSGLSGTAVSEITLGTGLSMTGSTLNATGATADGFVSVNNTDYGISATETYYTLSAITANRILTMAGTSAFTGRILKIHNTYTGTTFNWNFAGTAVKDVAGTTITTLAPTTLYILEYNGTNWIKIN